MTDKSDKTDKTQAGEGNAVPFVDPNSGSAPQPGGIVSNAGGFYSNVENPEEVSQAQSEGATKHAEEIASDQEENRSEADKQAETKSTKGEAKPRGGSSNSDK